MGAAARGDLPRATCAPHEAQVGELLQPGPPDLRRRPAAAAGLLPRETIAHEVLHLKVPNHGKVFRALLETYLARARQDPPGS